MWVPWQPSRLSDPEQEVTASIKALRTLVVHGGRVSISPSEVIDQPGYLEARRRAAALVTRPGELIKPLRFDTWTDVDSVGMDAYMDCVRCTLIQLRARGIPLGQALQRIAGQLGL